MDLDVATRFVLAQRTQQATKAKFALLAKIVIRIGPPYPYSLILLLHFLIDVKRPLYC